VSGIASAAFNACTALLTRQGRCLNDADRPTIGDGHPIPGHANLPETFKERCGFPEPAAGDSDRGGPGMAASPSGGALAKLNPIDALPVAH